MKGRRVTNSSVCGALDMLPLQCNPIMSPASCTSGVVGKQTAQSSGIFTAKPYAVQATQRSLATFWPGNMVEPRIDRSQPDLTIASRSPTVSLNLRPW